MPDALAARATWNAPTAVVAAAAPSSRTRVATAPDVATLAVVAPLGAPVRLHGAVAVEAWSGSSNVATTRSTLPLASASRISSAVRAGPALSIA